MEKLSLNGAWEVTQVGGGAPLPASVPGNIHADLLAASIIPDPFYRDNEDHLRWIGEAEWVYSRRFEVPAAMLDHQRVLLRCEGLDTLATVTINGQVVGSADNMFRTWEFDAKPALVPGDNTIEVHFASVLPVIRERNAQRPMPGWNGPKEVSGRAWVRKEPCNFGWDWGPVMVTCGIWRDISLLAFSEARLTDVHIRQQHEDGSVVLALGLKVTVLADEDVVARATVSLDGEPVATAETVQAHGSAALFLKIPEPKLWWPNNLGEQPLYDLTVELLARGRLLDTVHKRVGLRTLRLDRHPDQWGESFQFVVNGVPFFAKGANWIPADAVLARMTPERYRELLGSARDANMNMLRVWGGGIYEADCFYDLCDELGLCVWQDFMFACSAYPTFDLEFLASVKAEAEDNVRRLRHHACLALWCGNNELEQGLVADQWDNWHMSWEDYDKLFESLLPDVAARLDPDRDYWPCSPHTPSNRLDFNNPNEGDAHLWNVWHGRQPFEWYRTCEHRFNSEFGFQSFPEPQTVYGFTAPQDRNITTYIMEHHQRSSIGNDAIMQYMLSWFRLPTSFEMTLWLSQILQGMAMKYAVEHWRRAMPRGMGTLYWQLNDCWPVASWASIDFHGNWKALQYMARRFYNPLLLSALEDPTSGTVQLHVTNDLRQPVTADLNWWLTRVDGTPVADGTLPVQAPALANTLVDTLQLAAHLEKLGARDLLLGMELVTNGEVVSTNLVTFARPKHLELEGQSVRISYSEQGESVFAVTLEALKPMLWAWLELGEHQARYSDNFVHLFPGRPVTITVRPTEPMTLDQFEQALGVHSLVTTYS
ncbi:MAG: glycoside hydrolase family 2 protein [Armatimonadetes bacterium]|nr:glycoside hydrolase family 2 protein [Armatimonadota bacterium]